MLLDKLLELAGLLKQERLYVSGEREDIQKLHQNVLSSAELLHHLAWITRQQRLNLNRLLSAQAEVTPAVCCQRDHQLETANFIDSYKYLGYQDAKYGEFLKGLVTSPGLLASCVVNGEKRNLDETQKVIQILMLSLYNSCIMPSDEMAVLELLRHLISVQLATSANPLRLLKRGACSFSSVFKLFNEGLFSVKLFLTAALHKPVMQLLMEDEWFYDIDPDKALVRFPPANKNKRFGLEGSDQYKNNVKKYRETQISKLYQLTERFISSIKNSMYCFPQSLSWLISHMYQIVSEAGHITAEETRVMCADFVFSSFICPAICDPEPHGLTLDAPVSYIARHNLMQVATILQRLAVTRIEQIESKQRDLYDKFERDCMSSLLDSMIEAQVTSTPPQSCLQLTGLVRSAVLMTPAQLYTLISYLQEVQQHLEDSGERRALEELLSSLPSPLPASLVAAAAPPAAPTPVVTTATPPGTPSPSQHRKKGHRKKSNLLLSNNEEAMSSENGDAELPPEDVLAVTVETNTECPGMLSEEKVLSLERAQQQQRRVKYDGLPGDDNTGPEIQEKRTRFSLSHDQDSIGNTSDYLEAISEGASSHSRASVDLDDDDNENDNLSDMVSANVSGRGTPNISGRDTPLSHSGSTEGGERRASDFPVQKGVPREDVTERFGKFEIRQELERDEIKSTVSDTWSTDVLASDSEPPERDQLDRLEEVVEDIMSQNMLGVPLQDSRRQVSEMSETLSDAWSTDVLASETGDYTDEQRLLELDTQCLDGTTKEAGNQLQATLWSVSFSKQSVDDAMSSVSSKGGRGIDEGSEVGQQGDIAQGEGEVEGAVGGDEHSGRNPFFATSSDDELDGASSQPPMQPPILRQPNEDRNFKPVHRANVTASVVSEIVTNYTKIEETKYQYQSQQRVSDSLRYASGRVERVVSTFNPINSLEKTNLTSSESGYSTASAFRSTTGTNDNNLNGDNHVKLERLSGESESSSDSPSVSMLANDMSGLKLTEQQQNTSIDTNRLSAALNLFDPLLQDDGSEARGADANFDNQNMAENNPSSETNFANFDNFKDNDAGNRSSSDSPLPLANSAENSRILPSSGSDTAKSRSGTDESSGSNTAEHGHGGAIPKRISYDNISQKSDDIEEEKQEGKKKMSFFKSFKEKFHKGGKRKASKFTTDKEDTLSRGDDSEPSSLRSSQQDLETSGEGGGENGTFNELESSDDILAKYRKKTDRQTSAQSAAFPDVYVNDSEMVTISQNGPTAKDEVEGEEFEQPAYDPNNLESCRAFIDAKRKLRLVLSTTDFSSLPITASNLAAHHQTLQERSNQLSAILKVQLAEAINLQDKNLIAQLHEALRCLQPFDNDGSHQLVRCLRGEYCDRAPYVAYLTRCKQGLASTQAHLEQLIKRVKREKELCGKYFTSVCVRLYMEKKELIVHHLMKEFKKLKASDEKTDFVQESLNKLFQDMQYDPIWQNASESQIADAHVAIERVVLSHIYTSAMYPNGDMDISRDQLLHQHIQRLAQKITPNHPSLRIPKMYHHECPWPSAQAEIQMINVYKTPKDKLNCVVRCCSTIMNLLSMANEKSVPAADDFMPVFIFVLIKANPPSLLSTVQFVNSFYEKRLSGEEQYWWMQFTSGIEFVKTID